MGKQIMIIDCSAVATVSELLQSVADRNPRRSAILDGDRTWTFEFLNERVSALAACLLDAGAQPGENCGLLMDNVAEHVAAHFAAMRAGLVAVPINPRHHGREVLEQVMHADVRTLLVSPKYADRLQALVAGEALPDLTIMVPTANETEPCADLVRQGCRLVHLERLPRAERSFPIRLRSDPYILWYTSGTTGKPKGVLHDNNSGLCAIAAWIDVWKLTVDDCALAKNLYHVGMTASVMAPLAAGGSLAMMHGDFSVEKMLQDLARYRVTFLAAAPAMLSLLVKESALIGQYDLSALRVITSGSAPIDPTLFGRVVELLPAGITWTHSWGQTELNTGGCCLLPEDFLSRMGSIGKPIGCVDAASIRNEQGQELPQGQVGELCTRGPTVARSYYKEAPVDQARDGWHHTGDMAYVDAEGFYWLVGRTRDLIIRGGENIYPAEVERVLSLHPAVQESVVVGLADTVMGEVPVAFVELRSGSDIEPEALRVWCRGNLASYKCPVAIEIVDQFPRNMLGKIMRDQLRRHATELAQRIGR